jgi:hypothetical protein
MANLRTNNLSGEQGQKAIRGSVVFGGGDNSAAGLTIADNSELELGSETNWTIEFWLWLNGSVHGDYDVILGKGSATGNNYEYFVEVMSDNTLDFFSTTAGSAWDFQQQISPVLSADSWHHIAIVRNGSGSNSLKSYVNGQEYGSFTAQNIHTSAYPFGIGYFAGGNNLYSKVTVSNLRIVKGTSVYTAAFTPPFTELKAIPNTVLLCCQDSDNPFKEETGKTITGVGHLANGAVIHPRNNPPYGVDAGNTFGGPIQQSSQGYMYFPTGRTEERGRGRAAVGGGYDGSSVRNEIEYFNIQSMGTVIDFGNLTATTFGQKSNAASSTRGIIAVGGRTPTYVNTIEFITIATTSNATDFGDISSTLSNVAASSNQTRGVTFGGRNSTNVMEFITIATVGNASDFGDLTLAKRQGASVSSPTRGVYAGGFDDTNRINNIEFITIASAGNASDFGDLTVIRQEPAGASDNTRGVFAGGYDTTPSATRYNTIDFITIASAGNATDFGDTPTARADATGTSNNTRGVFAGFNDGGNTNLMAFVTIQTTGNASDFGDLITKRSGASNCSDSHGGLS